MVAIPQRYQIMISTIQPSHQDCHIVCFASRVHKVGDLNRRPEGQPSSFNIGLFLQEVLLYQTG